MRSDETVLMYVERQGMRCSIEIIESLIPNMRVKDLLRLARGGLARALHLPRYITPADCDASGEPLPGVMESYTAFEDGISSKTADEFMARYAKGEGKTVEVLVQAGRVPMKVERCSEFEYPHWEMGRSGPGWLDPEAPVTASDITAAQRYLQLRAKGG